MGFLTWVRRGIEHLFSGSVRRPQQASAYPDSCLRALKKEKWIIGGRFVSTDAILPDFRTADIRDDAYFETSVNWEDDSAALDFTLEGMGNESSHGAARLSYGELDRLRKRQESTGGFSYERSPVTGNDYHGNILFSSELPKAVIRQMASSLAHYSELIERQST